MVSIRGFYARPSRAQRDEIRRSIREAMRELRRELKRGREEMRRSLRAVGRGGWI